MSTITISLHDLECIADKLNEFVERYGVSGEVRVDFEDTAALDRALTSCAEARRVQAAEEQAAEID